MLHYLSPCNILPTRKPFICKIISYKSSKYIKQWHKAKVLEYFTACLPLYGEKKEGKNASAFEHFPTSKNSSILNKETMKAPKPPQKFDK